MATWMVMHDISYEFAVKNMIRLFEQVRLYDLRNLIRIRQLSIPSLTANTPSAIGTFDHTNTTMDQGDFLPGNVPNWQARWESIVLQARNFLERIRTTVIQRTPDESLYPTYVEDERILIDPLGYAPPCGYPRRSDKRTSNYRTSTT